MNQDECFYPLWLMVQPFSRWRRPVFGTASVPIIRMENIYVTEAKNTRKLKHIHRSALLFGYNDGMDYGKIVKQLREKTLLSQEEMAKKLGFLLLPLIVGKTLITNPLSKRDESSAICARSIRLILSEGQHGKTAH